MTTIKLLFVLAVLGAVAGTSFVYSGTYNMAADDQHWPVTTQVIEILRERSIAARLDGIAVPADLADPARIRRGAGNYEAMCVNCHLKPGLADSEIRKGLYPMPPDLAQPAAAHAHGDPNAAAARQFWIIKHGIKASGMPAWSQCGMDDGAIWDMVALLQRLAALSPTDYAALVVASDGHSHAGNGLNSQKTGHENHDHAH